MNVARLLPARRASAIVGMMLLAAAPSLAPAQGLPPPKPTPSGIWSLGGNVGGIVLSRFKSGLVNEMTAQGWGEDIGPTLYSSETSNFPSFSSDAIPNVRAWIACSLPRNFEVRLGWGNCNLGSVAGNRNGIGEVFVSGQFETYSAILFYGIYEPWIRVGAGPTLDRRSIASEEWSTSPGFSFLVHATLHQARWYFVAAEAEQHFSRNARIAQTIPGVDGNPHTFEISALPIDATWVGLSLGLRFGHGAGH